MMLSYKAYIGAIAIALFTSLPCYSFNISLGDDDNSLGIKVNRELDEIWEKPLPFGPASVRFSETSLWAADTLKNRLVEFDNKGNFKNSISLNLPLNSTIGDFCFGSYGKNKEKAVFVCDGDNPIIYVFNLSGEVISQFGSEGKSILKCPKKIDYYNDQVLVFDSVLSEIFIFTSNLSHLKTIKTASNNFTIDNEYLTHIANIGRTKVVQWVNLKDGTVYDLKPGAPAEIEIDYILCKEKAILFGLPKYKENSDKKTDKNQYLLVQMDKEENISKLYTDYPIDFMVRSFIKNKEGKIFQIKFDKSHPDKLKIEPLSDNFKPFENQ